MAKETTIRLCDLCDLISESVRPGTRPDALYLGLEHLASGRLTRIDGGSAAEVRSNTSAFQMGDVLYGKLRPYLDKAVLADCDGVCTTELLVLRQRADVDARYLAAVLHTPDFLEHAIAGTTGVQHPRTSWAHVREFGVPVYSLAEQSETADLLWQAHEAITRCEASLEGTQFLKRAAMRSLFTRGLRGEAQKETEIGPLPESWQVAALGSLCETTDAVDLQTDGNRRIEYVDVSAISRDHLRIEGTTQYTLSEAPGRARKRIWAGDVLFATIRPTLLRAAVVPDRLDGQVCSTAFCVLRRNQSTAVDRFIFYLVQREEFVQQLAAIETGASYPAVTDRMVKEQLVPVPPVEQQREIADILGAIDRKADLHRRKRGALEELFKALLRGLMTRKVRVGDWQIVKYKHIQQVTTC